MYKFLVVTPLVFCAVACGQDSLQKEATHEAKMTRGYHDLLSQKATLEAKINDFLTAKANECKPNALQLTNQGRLVCVKVAPPTPTPAPPAPAPVVPPVAPPTPPKTVETPAGVPMRLPIGTPPDLKKQ